MSNRSELKEIFKDTLSQAYDKYPYSNAYINYLNDFTYSFPRDKLRQYEFMITNHDCIDDCIPDIQRGDKVLLINSASMVHVGGGVANGATAQEEAICRRSNLYLALDKVNHTLHYPLFGKTKGIFTPGITIFKNSQYVTCDPYQIDILSIFSKPHNKIQSQVELDLLNKNVFETIFYVCNEQRVDTLVIVPIGCGAFRHDPNDVAETFNWYLNILPLQSIKKIIISCHTNERNYQAFQYYFNQ